jgi:hypothetical protein
MQEFYKENTTTTPTKMMKIKLIVTKNHDYDEYTKETPKTTSERLWKNIAPE